MSVANPSRLLTLQECRDYLGISDRTARRWLQAGTLKAYKVGPNGLWRVRPEDLAALLAASKR